MSEEEIIKFIKIIKNTPVVEPTKIYLTSGQAIYKEYFEKEGYEVVLTDTLTKGTDIIYGNFEE